VASEAADSDGALGRLHAPAMIFSRVRRRLLLLNVLVMVVIVGALGAAVVLLTDPC
jgi:hypothetical protein